ncbi:group III truncated hemoglobin [Novosphingobium album (ex Liu et al. 2023)]|uniref:Group III truncated hemoglobin n=1 Tax=Novosphingobium album (ex Liu et al. 2023) TaxID=3031130 RepID=A0ABT5WS50_9SPHN|nr:group III truncated hemoglobin [Novosphingobium album (ex Liu et al. 2023)]MDE8652881.1 group III truncated hemoglobin [Novosphingobium album (ex Liu et al. 2023)]
MSGDGDPEAAIMAMVRRFYDLCLADSLLGPMFRAKIADFAEHYGIVADFWSHSLLGTDRYRRGTPYVHHVGLKVEEDHFTRWMAAFEQAVAETLPAGLAETAMKRARHMTQSFRMGLLPLPKPAPQTT